ncbi:MULTISPECIES: hypothetical protein [Chromatiaceae]|uniref:hypothetical protein n=1 Tax=Chromatiaceae TaxID=1046 RepID=UPI0003802B12|nr:MULTISPECIES: hypothetical protein [Chromatiaceae]MDP2716912.1 hypothetical protein [Rheinheimera sp.]
MSELEYLIEQEQAHAALHANHCSDLIKKEGLASALLYCQLQGIDPPQCSLKAESSNARMLREKAARMLSDIRWWERRLGTKAGRDFEYQQILNGKVTNIISDESLEYDLTKKRR